MNADELRALTDAVHELSSSSKETTEALQGFSNELRFSQRLWRNGGTPKLIKIGLALIAFPDPTISDAIGSVLIAAGLIQLKMRNSTLHVEDVYKTFPRVVRELGVIKQSLV